MGQFLTREPAQHDPKKKWMRDLDITCLLLIANLLTLCIFIATMLIVKGQEPYASYIWAYCLVVFQIVLLMGLLFKWAIRLMKRRGSLGPLGDCC